MRKTIFLLLAVTLPFQTLRAEEVVGECYACCRDTACMAAAIGIGVLIFTGIAIVLVNDGTSSHSH